MTSFDVLAERAGEWGGTNGFRLMPDDPLHDAPATADVSVRAGGNVLAIGYTWSHPVDGEQDGFLVVGAGDEVHRVVGLWGDSWHQQPEARAFAGTLEGGVLRVGYEYAPGWRWVIEVDPTDAATLRIQMDNVVPADEAEGRAASTYPAMLMALHRA